MNELESFKAHQGLPTTDREIRTVQRGRKCMAMISENPRLRSNSEDGSSGWRQVAVKWMLQIWTFRGVGHSILQEFRAARRRRACSGAGPSQRNQASHLTSWTATTGHLTVCTLRNNQDRVSLDMETDVGQPSEILFRPVKRQKPLRRRAENDTGDLEVDNPSRPTQDPDQQSALGTKNAASTSQDGDGDSGDEASNLVRLRKPHRVRRGGIEFSTASQQRTSGDDMAHTEMSAEDIEGEMIRAKFDRFTAHTGQKVDVDKHMYGLHLRAYRCFPSCDGD